MRIFVIADVHAGNHGGFAGTYKVGLNWRARRISAILRQAATLANGETLVIAGDLFNSHEPPPQVIASTLGALEGLEWPDSKHSGQHPKFTVVVRGNHDANSTVPGDDALAPLAFVRGISVYDAPARVYLRELGELIAVPFRPGNPEEWLPAVLQEHADPGCKCRVLVTHFGIADETTPEYMTRGAIHVDKLRELCIQHGITHVFSGDWHSRKRWDFPTNNLTIVQVGALVPTGFNNPGLDGYGSVWELLGTGFGDTYLKLHELPGPRFVKLSSLTHARTTLAEWEREKPAVATELFVSLTVDCDQGDAAEEWLASQRDAGVIDGYSLETTQTDAAAHEEAIRDTLTKPPRFEEALHAAVHQQPLPAGVSADAVLLRCEDVLKRGAKA